MLAAQKALIREEVQEGTGAIVGIEETRGGAQTGVRIWFDDLGRGRSPIVEMIPKGLKRFEVRLGFGPFSLETVGQMIGADEEERQLARALINSIGNAAAVTIPGQSLADWKISGADFTILAEQKGLEDRFGNDALVGTCRAVVTPMLAAMAELYGYDPVEEDLPDAETALEGAVLISTVRRRERNPRNRLLCIRLHGALCAICGFDPVSRYGDAGGILEVHHLQPLSDLDAPRHYDPATDLVPLCPNCHRAVHTRRPLPWSPDDLQKMLKSDG